LPISLRIFLAASILVDISKFSTLYLNFLSKIRAFIKTRDEPTGEFIGHCYTPISSPDRRGDV
jgi:hypothetical protein